MSTKSKSHQAATSRIAARNRWEKTFCTRTIERLGDAGTAPLLALVAEDNEDDAALLTSLKRDPGAVGLDSPLTEINKLNDVRRRGLPDGLFADCCWQRGGRGRSKCAPRTAVAPPGLVVRTALYPVVGEKTLRDLAREAKANEKIFKVKVRYDATATTNRPDPAWSSPQKFPAQAGEPGICHDGATGPFPAATVCLCGPAIRAERRWQRAPRPWQPSFRRNRRRRRTTVRNIRVPSL